MSIIAIVYPAKCKDCKFIKPKKFGNMKRNICTNEKSPRFDPNLYLSRVTLKEKACDHWELS